MVYIYIKLAEIYECKYNIKRRIQFMIGSLQIITQNKYKKLIIITIFYNNITYSITNIQKISNKFSIPVILH